MKLTFFKTFLFRGTIVYCATREKKFFVRRTPKVRLVGVVLRAER